VTQYIQKIESLGKLIILNDGSKWSISPIDTIHTALWLPMDRVEVGMSHLTNLRNNKKVSAQRV
jgi:hypothetical protein